MTLRDFVVLLTVILCVIHTSARLRSRPRIHGGDVAQPHNFSFMASMRAKLFYDVYKHVCGASILSSKFILTAVHCTKQHRFDVNGYRIYIDAADDIDGIRYDIKRFIPHPEYKLSDVKNDLLFIELVKPIKFTYTVQPIKIYRERLSEGVRVSAAGWGVSNDNITALKFFELETTTNFNCIAKLVSVFSNPPVHSNVVCAIATEIGDGLCDGDSGGPLLYNKKLVGVSSWAFECGKGHPEGFQRISDFTDWIDEVLTSN